MMWGGSEFELPGRSTSGIPRSRLRAVVIAMALFLGLLFLAHPGMARAATGEAEVDVANEYDAEHGGPAGEVVRWGVLRGDADLTTPQGQPGMTLDRLAALAQAPPEHITEVILEGGAQRLSHQQLQAGGLAAPYLEFRGAAEASEIVLVLPASEGGAARTISSGPDGMLTVKLLLDCDVIHVGQPQVEQQGLPASEPLAGTPVEFKAHGEDLAGDSETWDWSFGDASAPSHEPAPTHTFAAAGQAGTTSYDVYAELTVATPSGEEATGVSFLRLPVRTAEAAPLEAATPPPAQEVHPPATPAPETTQTPPESTTPTGPVTKPGHGKKKREKKKAKRKKKRAAKKKAHGKKKRSAKKKGPKHRNAKSRPHAGLHAG